MSGPPPGLPEPPEVGQPGEPSVAGSGYLGPPGPVDLDRPVQGPMMPGVPSDPPGPNPPTRPPRADERAVSVPVRVLDACRVALQQAGPLAEAAEMATGAPRTDSSLSVKIGRAIHGLATTSSSGFEEPENVEKHRFKLPQLNERFLYDLMRERGWELATIIVGSAQGEALARRVIHGASLRSRLQEQVSVTPLRSGRRVDEADGWALVQRA